MHPDASCKVTTKLTSSSSREPPCTLSVGDKVFARNYHVTKVWLRTHYGDLDANEDTEMKMK